MEFVMTKLKCPIIVQVKKLKVENLSHQEKPSPLEGEGRERGKITWN
jgi:hypothetical protein